MESIRRLLMLRFVKKKKLIKENKQRLCPRIIKKLEKAKKDSTACIVIPGGHGQQFEVTHSYGSKAVVDIREMSCTCKRWDYTGIPCLHACASIMYANLDPEDFVHNCYTMANFELCYAQGIDPVPGKEDWPQADGEPCLPPQVMEEKKPGKRPMARRREEGEDRAANPYRSTRRGTQIRCQNCLQTGHNILTCKNLRHPIAKPRKERHAKRQRGEGGEGTSIDSQQCPPIVTDHATTGTTTRPPKLPTRKQRATAAARKDNILSQENTGTASTNNSAQVPVDCQLGGQCNRLGSHPRILLLQQSPGLCVRTSLPHSYGNLELSMTCVSSFV
ncbi:hypothetical protein Tsubulata_051095 [Turnera subulata]|uniref:SWIM-type domain-containing protein n=1 Tax=Turnera subulata TaxID=218843 RepID=A0A9Q0FV23_9ROSI|nr:hypothetical protein Tsubulata_051095 [Turnera subulata]